MIPGDYYTENYNSDSMLVSDTQNILEYVESKMLSYDPFGGSLELTYIFNNLTTDSHAQYPKSIIDNKGIIPLTKENRKRKINNL